MEFTKEQLSEGVDFMEFTKEQLSDASSYSH